MPDQDRSPHGDGGNGGSLSSGLLERMREQTRWLSEMGIGDLSGNERRAFPLLVEFFARLREERALAAVQWVNEQRRDAEERRQREAQERRELERRQRTRIAVVGIIVTVLAAAASIAGSVVGVHFAAGSSGPQVVYVTAPASPTHSPTGRP